MRDKTSEDFTRRPVVRTLPTIRPTRVMRIPDKLTQSLALSLVGESASKEKANTEGRCDEEYESFEFKTIVYAWDDKELG